MLTSRKKNQVPNDITWNLSSERWVAHHASNMGEKIPKPRAPKHAVPSLPWHPQPAFLYLPHCDPNQEPQIAVAPNPCSKPKTQEALIQVVVESETTSRNPSMRLQQRNQYRTGSSSSTWLVKKWTRVRLSTHQGKKKPNHWEYRYCILQTLAITLGEHSSPCYSRLVQHSTPILFRKRKKNSSNFCRHFSSWMQRFFCSFRAQRKRQIWTPTKDEREKEKNKRSCKHHKKNHECR